MLTDVLGPGSPIDKWCNTCQTLPANGRGLVSRPGGESVTSGGNAQSSKAGVPAGKLRWGLMLALGGLAVMAVGCGSAPTAAPTLMAAGQLPRSAFPAGTGTSKGGKVTSATIPLAKQSPTTALFTAIGIFQSCLTGMGVKFIGAPSAGDPNSAANNPTYLKSLATCAAQSNIVQALKTEQTAQDNLTPKQVKVENEDYLKWRNCMIGRGWQIPTPTPNAKGLLFSFGGTGGASAQIQATARPEHPVQP